MSVSYVYENDGENFNDKDTTRDSFVKEITKEVWSAIYSDKISWI
ncbi:hypothetical protein FACS189459_6800 [Bacilli bacterium]|nr:hypothetical protein FACS189459_6800 [Bacilli bacterium]